MGGHQNETLESPDAAKRRTDKPRHPSLWVVWSPDTDAVGRSDARPSKPIVLGRGDDADIVVRDPWLSSHHLRVEPGPAGALLVTDLDTRNGSFTNRRRFEHETLRHGGVLRCGATLLVLDLGERSDDTTLVGWSRQLSELRRRIREVAADPHPVHLFGPSGAGKEVVAHQLHDLGGRTGHLVPVNMAAIPASLAESQLFGHVEGAFTGAAADVVGFFEQADGGTLFLDEIGDADPAIQAKLLRVLETGELFRVGSTTAKRVDVRLVTATHHDLEKAVQDGRFRQDLYWRLVHTTLPLARLSSRRLDIVPLIEHFLKSSSAPTTLSVAANDERLRWSLCTLVEALLCHSWPGNVRQLRSEVHRLARALEGAGDELPAPEQCFMLPTESGPVAEGDALDAAAIEAWLDDPDALLDAILTHADGNITDFARRFAPIVDRRADSLRRRIYRCLGEARLSQLRR